MADFGTARIVEDEREDFTNLVCTSNYRCPEMFLGETVYGPAVDMWSIGYVHCNFSATRELI